MLQGCAQEGRKFYEGCLVNTFFWDRVQIPAVKCVSSCSHSYRAITLHFILNAISDSAFNEDHCSSAKYHALAPAVGELIVAACL